MIKKRCLAFLIDFVLVSFFSAILELLVGQFITDPFWGATIISLAFTYMFTKDSFTGRGLGKKAMNISVVNMKNRQAASAWATCVRNVFNLLWPLELLVLIIANRRLGDMVTGTDVIEGKITHKFSIESIFVTIITWAILVGISYLIFQNSIINAFYYP